MIKKIIALVSALLMLMGSATAVLGAGYTQKQLRIADALNHIELFLGTHIGYELERELTRLEGLILLIRMLGKERETVVNVYEMPFEDVDSWAVGYVGYAYEHGITHGVSDVAFGSDESMTDYMFLTLMLRALGYDDYAEGAKFTWDDPYDLAYEVGLIAQPKADTQFTRGDAIEVFWNVLALDGYKMGFELASYGLFTATELRESIEIYQYGYIVSNPYPNVPEVPNTDVPGDTDKPTDTEPPVDTSAPEDILPEDTEPEDTESDVNDKPTDLVKPEDTAEPEDTEPEDTEPDYPFDPSKPLTYEEYLALDEVGQLAYFNSFSNPADFFVWQLDAKAEYEAQNPSIEVGGDGNINIGDIIG